MNGSSLRHSIEKLKLICRHAQRNQDFRVELFQLLPTILSNLLIQHRLLSPRRADLVLRKIEVVAADPVDRAVVA